MSHVEDYAHLLGYSNSSKIKSKISDLGHSQKKLLQQTLKNIPKYRFIGLAEEYKLSALYISYLYNLPMNNLDLKANSFEDQCSHPEMFREVIKETLTKRTIKCIEQHNDVDIQIYKEIEKLFWEKVTTPKFIAWLRINVPDMKISKHPKFKKACKLPVSLHHICCCITIATQSFTRSVKTWV
jgi:hypothetical protein